MSNKMRKMIKRANEWHKKHDKSPMTKLTKHAMTYRCRECGKEWRMWLQTGLEEHGENHKPVPFAITCKCGGIAEHVRWNMDIKLADPIPIDEFMNYFANVPEMDCGKPILR